MFDDDDNKLDKWAFNYALLILILEAIFQALCNMGSNAPHDMPIMMLFAEIAVVGLGCMLCRALFGSGVFAVIFAPLVTFWVYIGVRYMDYPELLHHWGTWFGGPNF